MPKLSEYARKLITWIASVTPFVALGAWLAVQYMKFKNLKLIAKIMKLEETEALDENKKQVEQGFSGKSDSDIIDTAVSKGSKMP